MLQARTLAKGESSTLKIFCYSNISCNAVVFPTGVMSLIYRQVNQTVNKLTTKKNE